MLSIFYDLETSDQYFIGQILNFSFICLDERFNVVAEFSDNIKISRLQLPSPSAILANKTDVLKHQKECSLSETEAMIQIAQFIDSCIAKSDQKVCLVGYNSTRFDLPFLRTSLIRNGINPYFRGQLVYRDLLQVARRLSTIHKNFPRKCSRQTLEAGTKDRMSLSLETLTNEFGLLKGHQVHSAREDVLITIELAKYFIENYKLDVRTYEPYEVQELHKFGREGKVFGFIKPQYDLALSHISETIPYTCLDFDYKYALWIDLDRYRDNKGRRSIVWLNQNAGVFYSDKKEIQDADYRESAKKALKEFSTINTRNFFTTSTCDIEQDIYRLDISLIDTLRRAIYFGEKKGIMEQKNKDAKIVLMRYELANYNWGGSDDERVKEMLKKYALYRYGGQLSLQKWAAEADSDSDRPEYHATLRDYLNEIEIASKNVSAPDAVLLSSLKEFYLSSDIYRCCGNELTKTGS